MNAARQLSKILAKYGAAAGSADAEHVSWGVHLAPPAGHTVTASGPDLKWIGKMASAIAAIFSVAGVQYFGATEVTPFFVGQPLRAKEAADCFNGCFQHAWSAVGNFDRSKSSGRGDVVIRNWLGGYAQGILSQYKDNVKAKVQPASATCKRKMQAYSASATCKPCKHTSLQAFRVNMRAFICKHTSLVSACKPSV